MAANDHTPNPVRGRAFRAYFTIVDNVGAGITASWTSPTCSVIGDGVVLSSLTPVQVSGTECGYVDIDAAKMAANCIVLIIKVGNANALPRHLIISTTPIDLGTAPGAVDQDTIQVSQMVAQVHAAFFNRVVDNGATITCYRKDNVTPFSVRAISGDIEIGRAG